MPNVAKKKKSARSTVISDEIEGATHVVRGQRVMLDADLAKLYGVTTAALNQAMKRDNERFPGDFAYQLTRQEFTTLKSQNVISKSGRGGRTSMPWAFTEHGMPCCRVF